MHPTLGVTGNVIGNHLTVVTLSIFEGRKRTRQLRSQSLDSDDADSKLRGACKHSFGARPLFGYNVRSAK